MEGLIVEWSEREFKEIRPGILGATIHTAELTATLYRYEPESHWEEHRHTEDQITSVVRGTIQFIVDGRPVPLTEGQLAALPGGILHSALAGADGAETLNIWTRRCGPGDD